MRTKAFFQGKRRNRVTFSRMTRTESKQRKFQKIVMTVRIVHGGFFWRNGFYLVRGTVYESTKARKLGGILRKQENEFNKILSKFQSSVFIPGSADVSGDA